MNTGNSSAYSLVEEIKFHSESNGSILNINGAATVTNAGVGEEKDGLFDEYLNEYSDEIKTQQETHGEEE